MKRPHEVRHVSVWIARMPAEVYVFAADPSIRFTEPNALGVMDHDVELENGIVVHNPMRVVRNGDGSELVFTLIRQPGMSDRRFAADAEAVEKDLRKLKSLLEGAGSR